MLSNMHYSHKSRLIVELKSTLNTTRCEAVCDLIAATAAANYQLLSRYCAACEATLWPPPRWSRSFQLSRQNRSTIPQRSLASSNRATPGPASGRTVTSATCLEDGSWSPYIHEVSGRGRYGLCSCGKGRQA